MCNLLKDADDVESLVDNILIQAPTKQQLEEITWKVTDCLKKAGWTGRYQLPIYLQFLQISKMCQHIKTTPSVKELQRFLQHR